MKKALVLLPGLLSNERIWAHVAAHLSDCAEIYILPSVDNSREKMVRSILERAPPTFALAGHSMGGWLCFEILRAAPERVERLCLLNTTARADSEEKRRKRHAMIERVRKGEFCNVVEELVEFFVFQPEAKEGVRKMFLEVGEKTFIAQEEAMLQKEEVLSLLPRIVCPTWVIHAAEDRNFSLEEQEEIMEKIPHAKLAVVEEAGHMSPLETPQAITALLRLWLTF